MFKDRWTDRQKAMPMSPPCTLHRWAQKRFTPDITHSIAKGGNLLIFSRQIFIDKPLELILLRR